MALDHDNISVEHRVRCEVPASFTEAMNCTVKAIRALRDGDQHKNTQRREHCTEVLIAALSDQLYQWMPHDMRENVLTDVLDPNTTRTVRDTMLSFNRLGWPGITVGQVEIVRVEQGDDDA